MKRGPLFNNSCKFIHSTIPGFYNMNAPRLFSGVKLLAGIIIMGITWITPYQAHSQTNSSLLWAKADSLSNMGQPNAALEIVEKIYSENKGGKNDAEFLKASIYRMALMSHFEEDFMEKIIKNTESDVLAAKQPAKNVLHSVLAELYWKYYENHRPQFLNRTETRSVKSDDISTWDLRTIVRACMEHYARSLENPGLLKLTDLGAYQSILVSFPESRKIRPTLYDFLYHRAIDFYMNSETGLTQPASRFLVDDPRYFSPTGTFLALPIQSADTFSFPYHAFQLLQAVVNFHSSDEDPSALIDVELKRLRFIYDNCVLPQKDSLYFEALSELEKRFIDHAASAEVSYAMAQLLSTTAAQYIPLVSDLHKWDYQKAKSIAQAAIRRFPDSDGAYNCKGIIAQIEFPSFDITTDRAVVPGKPALALVNYRNISNLYLRIILIDPKTDKERSALGQEELIKDYIEQKAVMSWEQMLPNDRDFQFHKAEIRIPGLEPGYYVMLACADKGFSKDSIITLNRFWSSRISYVSRRNVNGSYDVFVLDRQEGNPIQKVKVEQFYQEYDYMQRKFRDEPGAVLTTDKNGFVRIPSTKSRNSNQYYLVFTSDMDKWITENYFSSYSYEPGEPKAYTTTHFFTDRSIYRPGQTIYFKGIVIEQKGEEVKIRPNFHSTVTFYDVNGQKVSSQELTTNDFGSFAGNFTAPMGVLTGQMSIQSETGSTTIRVEEYKRPKFEVTFKPVEGSYKLNEMVTVTGKAMAYAGNPISGASVTFHVTRMARFPYMYWGWREWMPDSPKMEIVNSTATTGNNGEFTIRFKAIPDPTIDWKFDPVFDYSISATITDLNGETHDASATVSVGTKALIVSTDIPDEFNIDSTFKFTLSTTNLNGQKEPSKGILTISKMMEPQRILRSRNWGRPDRFTMVRLQFEKDFPNDAYDNEADITTWPVEKSLYSYHFDSKMDSLIKPGITLPAGTYILEIETRDAFGSTVVKKQYFTAYAPASGTIPGKKLYWLTQSKTKAEPGETIYVQLFSAANKVHAIYEISKRNSQVQAESIDIQGSKSFRIPVTEDCRGNFNIAFTFIKYNRSFQVQQSITVPYTNKTLDLQFSTFRNKLEPGQEEEWNLTIKDPNGEKAIAELLAGMYDASLDAFAPHTWSLDLFNNYGITLYWEINSSFGALGSTTNYYRSPQIDYRSKTYDFLNWFGFEYYSPYRPIYGIMDVSKAEGMRLKDARNEDELKIPARAAEEQSATTISREIANTPGDKGIHQSNDNKVKPVSTAGGVKVRSDFNETAFFYPQLATNAEGNVIIKFKVPESLTRWKMMGLAYTKDLKIGKVEKSLVTQKDLMVVPNAPRFFREGDKMQFSVKVSNISSVDLPCTANIHFFDAFTMKPVDSLLLSTPSKKDVLVKKGSSSVISWDIQIPEGIQAIVYRVSASSDNFSDGEEAAVPVLTNRMLVTESLPLPINGNQKKDFSFTKLYNSGKAGSTLKNYKLTLEFTSNPAWYAVQALPYLMEYPYECAEQIFSRYYSNSIASYIANSDPKIKRVFESWKNISPDALKSNLEKNQELKSVLLEESPWVREAHNESEQKQRIAILFDLNRMSNELGTALKKLKDMQTPNGGWPWFPGSPDDRYITQHIVTGLGHLEHLGVTSVSEDAGISEMAKKAIRYIDLRIAEDFRYIKEHDTNYLKNDHLGYDNIQYLYARSYFMKEFPMEEGSMDAFRYFKKQAATYWKNKGQYLQGMIALALQRFDDTKTPALILRSISDKALHNEEMGMYWRNETNGWFWYQAPIETQALLIEAYDEILKDTKSVDEMKIWLLKQKQTQNWETTKSTTEAIYALLLRGTDLLSSDKLAQVKVGNELINPEQPDAATKPEAGTGYFKTSWDGHAITPDMGKVTVTNPNPTVAWGAMYWQYFEQLDKITVANTPLKLSKKLFREVNSETGPVMEEVTENSPLHLGDKVVVRVELRSDRDMEYVHLKDMRAAGFEPLNTISGYHWQDGLGYYEAPRDASTNFFINYLPKGTYVFEYRLFATQKGDFSNGITSVECMYAPEFSAHSEGIRVRVE
ncbi:MAG: hypothetical protein HXX13_16430 [Bacteroidetes bacterium]|nr:hypothetical protein [Bacteroidota bacterium]